MSLLLLVGLVALIAVGRAGAVAPEATPSGRVDAERCSRSPTLRRVVGLTVATTRFRTECIPDRRKKHSDRRWPCVTTLDRDGRVIVTGWRAPQALGPIDAVVRVPGSKSVTNRALVLAALSSDTSRLTRPLRSRDTSLMVSALRVLGAEIVDDGDDWLVSSGSSTSGGGSVDVGNAGTVLRFTPPLAAFGTQAVSFDGDDAVRRRPVGALLAALRGLGSDIEGDAVPFTVNGGGGLRGGDLTVDASASSQLVSALLLVAPAMTRGLRLRHDGARPVPNAPHLAMTTAMLRSRGVAIEVEADRAGAPMKWAVEPGPVASRDEMIEPDLSSAAPFLAAAVATGGRVRVLDWPTSTTQPGGALPELMEAFGARVDRSGPDLVVTGGGTLTGVDVDLRNAGELTPVIAALAALASTPSRLAGVDYLRGHETDRLAALARELSALGAQTSELADGLSIVPQPLHGNVFSTYDDHRMAMAGAIVGLVTPGVVLDDVETTAKTFPGFDRAWTAMLAGQAAS